MDDTIDADELPAVVARARSHDVDAWEALYRHCRPKLWRYCRRRLAGDDACEDAISEAFVRAVSRIHEFSWEGAGFDAWMYGITRNVVLEAYRSAGRDQRLAARAAAGGEQTVIRSEVGEALERDEEHALVRRAFDRLDDADRELLEMRVVGGLSADEVAVVLEKNAGAIRMAQSRALGRLRRAMEELGHG